jgi:phosphoglycolate phosphatase-like HAD superfamily hydrolase
MCAEPQGTGACKAVGDKAVLTTRMRSNPRYNVLAGGLMSVVYTGQFKICIFDVNGVLIDSNLANARAMAETFTPDPVVQQQIVELYLQLTGIDRGSKIRIIQDRIFRKSLVPGEFESIWEKLRDLAKVSMSAAPLIAGSREVLTELGRRKIIRAALSNTPEVELSEIMAARGLDSFLDIIRGGGNWPKSESLARFLREFGFDPLECIFLGDGKGDLAAARHAGVPFFGIDPGTGEFDGEEGIAGPFDNLADWGRRVLGIDLSGK